MGMPSFLSGEEQKTKLFLAILLTEQSVQAVLWSVTRGQIKVEKKSETYQINQPDQTAKQTDLALQDLGEQSENLKEVVFGLPPSWSDAQGVLDNKKPLLKKLTEDLSLEAIGFVVISEAVVKNLLKTEKNLSAVLVFYTNNQIDVVLVENGVIKKTESVFRSEDSVGDLVEGLARIRADHPSNFPPQLRLISVSLDQEELYEQQQTLINHEWVGEEQFVSVPTITMADLATAIESLVNQGGRAAAESEDIAVSEKPTAAKPTAETTPVKESEPADFAFTEVKMNQETMPDDNLAVVPKSFGIPIMSKNLPTLDEHSPTSTIKHDDDEPEKPITAQKPKKKSKLTKWLFKHKLYVGLGFGAGLLALLLISVVMMAVAGRAVINLTLKERPIAKDLTITLDASLAESNFEKLTLKSELKEKTLTFNQTNETTGTTLVGEKATGKIQIVNKTDGVKTFAAGTSFSSGSLRFTLNDDITVASSSVEIKQNAEVKTYGTSDAVITAVKIGAEGNLAANTNLTVGDFSSTSYEAHTIEALTGGSSRELRVVSETDQAQLLAEVKKKILELAVQQFHDDSIADGQKTFVSTGKLTVDEANYSAKVGDEAKTLTLDLVATVKAIAYLNQDLKPLAQYVLTDLIPSGYQMINKDPEILSAINSAASGSAVVIEANISTKAVPIVDLDALRSEIAGQSLSSAEAILKGKGEIKDFTIQLIPAIMHSLWKKLPGNANNITINAQ